LAVLVEIEVSTFDTLEWSIPHDKLNVIIMLVSQFDYRTPLHAIWVVSVSVWEEGSCWFIVRQNLHIRLRLLNESLVFFSTKSLYYFVESVRREVVKQV
jgi:hypothetical protein